MLVRWASALFAYSTVSALRLAALPVSFSRPFAVPTGVALIGPGISLWRDQRRQAQIADAPAATWAAQAGHPLSPRELPQRAGALS